MNKRGLRKPHHRSPSISLAESNAELADLRIFAFRRQNWHRQSKICLRALSRCYSAAGSYLP